jgi:DNA-binding transcriptional MerR regulator
MTELMTIGRFARLSGLSVHALRHYADVGLLQPADVDQRTGYRRYSSTQLSTARLMVDLRWLDLPLEDIRVILSDPASNEAASS